MKIIPLPNSKFALVDDVDFDEMLRYQWRLKRSAKKRTYYAYFIFMGKHITMQSIIASRIGLNSLGLIDHKNCHGFDNRRENLRIATASQNMANRRKGREKTSSRFKGVHRLGHKWCSYITENWEVHRLGYFKSEEAAARAYDRAALKYFGEFARLNFPEAKSV